MRYILTDRVSRVDHRFVNQWTGGVGEDATFRKDSAGYYVVLDEGLAAIYVGEDEPTLAAGDRVRLTLEKV